MKYDLPVIEAVNNSAYEIATNQWQIHIDSSISV